MTYGVVARASGRVIPLCYARRWMSELAPPPIGALLDGRYNVALDDLRAVAMSALRHRVILNFEGEAEGITADAIVRTILDSVAPPAVE